MNGTTYHYGIPIGNANLRVIMPKVNDVSDQLISDPNPQMKKKFALPTTFFGINALGMILLLRRPLKHPDSCYCSLTDRAQR